MLRLTLAVFVLVAFACVCWLEPQASAPATTLAAKCTGKDPCTACSNCEKCSYCKNGKTCGACKPTKKMLAANVCM